MHRKLLAEASLHHVQPDDSPSMLRPPPPPFLSLPTSDLKISGPFEELLQSLLEKLGVKTPPKDSIIVLCLSQQLSSIFAHFPNAKMVQQFPHRNVDMGIFPFRL